MASSSSSPANSEQPTFVCKNCKTEICKAEYKTKKNGEKDYMVDSEPNLVIADGAVEFEKDGKMYVDLACPGPGCGIRMGEKRMKKKQGEVMVPNEGKSHLYMSYVGLKIGNIIHTHNF